MTYKWSEPKWNPGKCHLRDNNGYALCNSKMELDSIIHSQYLSFINMGLCQKCLKIFIKMDKENVDEINKEKQRLGETDFIDYEEITKQFLRRKAKYDK
jgi:hypothetical protein